MNTESSELWIPVTDHLPDGPRSWVQVRLNTGRETHSVFQDGRWDIERRAKKLRVTHWRPYPHSDHTGPTILDALAAQVNAPASP